MLVVFSPCITVWKFPEGQYVNIAKLAVESRFWPLYEYENEKYAINYSPKKYTPVEEFLKSQERFKHLFKNHYSQNVIARIQHNTDLRWGKLLQKTGK